MAHAASMLERSGDPTGALLIQDRMRVELSAMPIEEALPLVVSFFRSACVWKAESNAH
jgi:hypothetical protein